MTRTVEVPTYTVEQAVLVPASTATLVIVDMQNDFVTTGGALVGPDAAGTVPVIKRRLDRARAAGVRVFFTQDTHGPGDPEFLIWGEHVLEGAWGCGYKVILPIDAISALTPFDLQTAIRQTSFLYRGTITTSEALAFSRGA